MEKLVGLHQLSFDHYRASGVTPSDTPALRRRIAQHGFIEPIVVRPQGDHADVFEILVNAEAVVAAGKLQIEKVPVLVREDLDGSDAVESIRDYYSRAENNPISQAEWYQEYLESLSGEEGDQASIAKAARLTGKSRSQISRLLALLQLPVAVQGYLREGRLSASHARVLVTIQEPKQQERLAKKAVDESLSFRAFQALVAGKAGRAEATAAKDPSVARLEERVSDLIGSPFTIDLERGEVRINYYKDLEILQGILTKLGYSEVE